MEHLPTHALFVWILQDDTPAGEADRIANYFVNDETTTILQEHHVPVLWRLVPAESSQIEGILCFECATVLPSHHLKQLTDSRLLAACAIAGGGLYTVKADSSLQTVERSVI
jgi:hypothetical protein